MDPKSFQDVPIIDLAQDEASMCKVCDAGMAETFEKMIAVIPGRACERDLLCLRGWSLKAYSELCRSSFAVVEVSLDPTKI